MLHRGLYEQVINNALSSELSAIPEARKEIVPIDKAEASKALTQYLADVVRKGLDNVVDNGGDISTQVGLANQIIELIQNTTKEADFATLGVDPRAEPEHHSREFHNRPAIYSPHGAWQQGAALCP